MKRTYSLSDLRSMLIYAEARCFDNDWLVRMDARKEVETLKRKISNAEKREAKIRITT